jgi:4-hydroxy-2-oxoheptanedioate aldolase
MNPSIVKRKLAANEPVLAAKVNFMSPQIVEMMGMLGYDCLWICHEHLYSDPSRLDHMVTAARAAGMDVMLRRAMGGAYTDFLQPLELGVHGFMLPRVRSLELLRQTLNEIKFPPEGKRGLDGASADADFGLLELPAYLARANRETFVVAQIEDTEALELVDDIAALPGVDVVFIGHADLALALGIPGQIRDPQVLEAIDRVAEACRRHGKHAGIPARDAADAAALMEKGFRFFTTGADFRFVRDGLLQTKEAFGQVGFSFRGA